MGEETTYPLCNALVYFSTPTSVGIPHSMYFCLLIIATFCSLSSVNLFISEIPPSHQVRMKQQLKDSHLIFFSQIGNDINEIFFKGNNELTTNSALRLSRHNVATHPEKNDTQFCVESEIVTIEKFGEIKNFWGFSLESLNVSQMEGGE